MDADILIHYSTVGKYSGEGSLFVQSMVCKKIKIIFAIFTNSGSTFGIRRYSGIDGYFKSNKLSGSYRVSVKNTSDTVNSKTITVFEKNLKKYFPKKMRFLLILNENVFF